MPVKLQPVLAQFGTAPESNDIIPTLDQDRLTGLLHRKGSVRPLIDELTRRSERRQHENLVVTVLTRFNDPVDPDMVRELTREAAVANSVIETVMTKITDDPGDPDMVRFAAVGRLVQTDMQRVAPDPDLIRSESHKRIA